VRMGRDDALDIFRKWAAENSLIRWQGHSSACAFAGFGRVLALDDIELRLMADDRKSELVVRLDVAIDFGYGDERHAPPEEAKYGDTILVFFSSPEEDEPDFITLAAIA
jgi:hypothetical protein